MVPQELSIAPGIYVSPLLVVAFLALAAATVTGVAMNRFRLTRFVVNPPLVFVAFIAIYIVLIGTFIIPV